jgi:hypothetical protein
MAERTGTHLLDFATGRSACDLRVANMEEGEEVNWVDCPDGVVFRRIPYVAPFNGSDSWLLDLAKFKTHGMGVTLSVKNIQGMCVPPYIRYCEGVNATLGHPLAIRENFQPDLEEHVAELHAQHVKEGYARWERPGRDWNSGYGMEMWAQRTCDNHSASNIGLAMVEGVYGRNGNAFMDGPGPGGKAEDFMTNIVIFGKNPFLVDIVGTWLAGHEAGSLGLFRIALERGLCDVLNPMDVPVYLWTDDDPVLTPLDEFERTPLLTYYLRKDWGGQSEPYWHMVDDPYDYGASSARLPERPALQTLGTRAPNSEGAKAVLEYHLPVEGPVSLYVVDSTGQRVAGLFEGHASQGVHAASWAIGRRSGGRYAAVLQADGQKELLQLTI